MFYKGVQMRKFLSYLLLLSSLTMFASACSSSGDSNIGSSESEEYLPIQLRADAGRNEITLEWKMLPAADTYNIYYLEDDGSNEQPNSAKMKSDGNKIEGIISAPYPVTGLQNGTTYWFALSAKAEGEDESDLTKTIYSTPQDNPPLPAPENVRANAGDGEATITWDAVPYANGYKVYYYTSFTNYGESDKINNNFYTFTGLNNGQEYIFWVAALDGDDDSTTGDSSASFIYAAQPSIHPPPVAPTNLAIINNNNGNIIVEWDTMSDATAYNIYIAKAKGVTKLTGAVTNIPDPDTSPQQGSGTILTNGTYYIVVTSLNNNGESAESREVSIPITDNP